jgi:hypothetical protein
MTTFNGSEAAAGNDELYKTTDLQQVNRFWDSKPELFSDIACLQIPYQPCIVLFGIFFSGNLVSNRRELRLHLNVVIPQE